MHEGTQALLLLISWLQGNLGRSDRREPANIEVMHYFSFCGATRTAYAITEACQRGTLASWLKEEGVLPVPMVLSLVHQSLEAVRYMHSKLPRDQPKSPAAALQELLLR